MVLHLRAGVPHSGMRTDKQIVVRHSRSQKLSSLTWYIWPFGFKKMLNYPPHSRVRRVVFGCGVKFYEFYPELRHFLHYFSIFRITDATWPSAMHNHRRTSTRLTKPNSVNSRPDCASANVRLHAKMPLIVFFRLVHRCSSRCRNLNRVIAYDATSRFKSIPTKQRWPGYRKMHLPLLRPKDRSTAAQHTYAISISLGLWDFWPLCNALIQTERF